MGFIVKNQYNQQQNHNMIIQKIIYKNNVLQMNSRSPVLKCLPYKEKSYKSNHYISYNEEKACHVS